MSMIKTSDEIAILKEGGTILSRALRCAMTACVVGVGTAGLDRIAREEIERSGGTPSFLGYRIHPRDPAFPSTLCISINDEVVHGPAVPDRTIMDGDIVGLDIGCWYKGLATDMAATVIVGDVPEATRRLVRDTREALIRGISVITAGGWVRDVSAAIEDFLKPKGYGIVKDLVGHGVGHAVHEEPPIPNYRDSKLPNVRLQKGMVLAIEPMVTLGSWEVVLKPDHWTIATKDHSLSAHWEVTVAVTATGYELLTPWPDV